MAVDERFPRDLAQEQVEPEGTFNEIITGPVADWATDFSHLEPEWAADPYPIQDDLRERCPIAHTGRFGGGWLPVKYEQHIPVRVIADMLGFPPEDGPQFREFVNDLLEGINLESEEREERIGRLFDYLLEQVHDHLDRPREDLTTYLLEAEIYGQKLT